ncbi:unnamed protein product [Diamesa hyperborea]
MLVFDLQEEIFKHLKVRDLDNFSEISKASKSGYLRKVDPSDVIAIQNEPRMTREFHDLPSVTKMNIFKGLQLRYQNVTIDCTSNADAGLYLNLFKCFGPSMINLKIKQFDLNDVQLREIIRLSNVESLELIRVSTKILDFIEHSTVLTSINFGFFNETFDDNSINRMNKLLVSSRNSLRELKLSDRVFRGIFNVFYDEALMGLQLIQFDITNCDVYSLENQTNFRKFLASQATTLKSLKMSCLTGYEAADVFELLENMEHISIETSYTSSGPQLPINNSIIEMELIGINVTLEVIKPYLDATPNLEFLHISNLSNQVVNYIIAKKPTNFKKLSYNWSNEKLQRANFFLEKIEI